ncbi:MAG TPA: hypothetical protein VF701_13680, partial [Thermoanaerobaculia bacterium]
MSHRENSPLFTKDNLRDALDQHHARIQAKVDSISREQFQASTDQQLFEHLHDTFLVSPIVLHEEQATMKPPEDTFVDVSGWAHYVSIGDGPAPVKGVRVRVHIPWVGDDALWKWSPDPMWTISAWGNVIASENGNYGTLELVISQPNQEPAHRVRETL